MNWVEDDGSRTAYAVNLPKVGIVLKLVAPVAEPDYLLIALRDERRQVISGWQVDDPEHLQTGVQSADWNLLKSLFDEARKQASGWDKLVSEVKDALASHGRIGLVTSRK